MVSFTIGGKKQKKNNKNCRWTKVSLKSFHCCHGLSSKQSHKKKKNFVMNFTMKRITFFSLTPPFPCHLNSVGLCQDRIFSGLMSDWLSSNLNGHLQNVQPSYRILGLFSSLQLLLSINFISSD